MDSDYPGKDPEQDSLPEAEGSGSPDPTVPLKPTDDDLPDVELVKQAYSEEALAAAAADEALLQAARLENERRQAEEQPEAAVLDIREDGSQFQFDQNLVVDTLRERRVALAGEKLAYQLAKRGLHPGGKNAHPEQIKAEIRRVQQQIEWLIEQANSNEPIPAPSDLEVAASLPAQGEARKIGLEGA